ncbi:hypothetical protein ACWEJQ_23770 [Streptomyces albidoflavus]
MRDRAAEGVLAGDERYTGGRRDYEAALQALRQAMRTELGSDG